MGPTNFQTIHKTFIDSLKKAFKTNNIDLLEETFKSLKANDTDKKSALDQSLREVLLTKAGDIPAIEAFITFAIQACRREMATATIPVVLLGDIFDAVTLDKCEKIFAFVEDNVAVWKEGSFFASCKNNLLRMCNDLLRRLSRSQNTVFCGRILLFLAKFFPFSERSGLNIISEFNLENITEYGADGNDMGDQLGGEESTAGSVKVDYNLYCKFWALQDFFRNPNQCYDTVSWKLFASHSTSVLSAFSSFKLDEPRGSKSSRNRQNEERLEMEAIEKEVKDSQHFFAKFLTNPKLLSLQLSDSNFRRSVLVQCLILFQYLNSVVKFKAENQCLTTAQTDWLKDTEALVYKLLAETPPNGKKFSETVQHMLSREELWNNWKNDGCKEFKRPLEAPEDAEEKTKSPLKKQRKLAGDLIKESTRNNKFYMGNPELTRLWNLCPDNLQSCKGIDRNFVPTLEQYLESPKEKIEQSFEWRALRLLAMQSPHFFTLFNTTPTYKVSDYLDSVRKKIQKDKTEIKTEILEDTSSQTDTQENDAEHEAFDTEAEQMDSDLLKSEQFTDDDKNVHKTHTVTKEQINEIAEHIKDWKKLGTKFGYSADELLFFETENPTVFEQCRAMLRLWFDDDEDASLDNLAYILEGLGMLEASEEVKKIIEALEKADENDM